MFRLGKESMKLTHFVDSFYDRMIISHRRRKNIEKSNRLRPTQTQPKPRVHWTREQCTQSRWDWNDW